MIRVQCFNGQKGVEDAFRHRRNVVLLCVVVGGWFSGVKKKKSFFSSHVDGGFVLWCLIACLALQHARRETQLDT